MKARVSFFETEQSVDDCENIVADAIGQATGVELTGLGDTRAASIGDDVQNIDVYAELQDLDPEDDDRTVKGRINEFLMGTADCRLTIVK